MTSNLKRKRTRKQMKKETHHTLINSSKLMLLSFLGKSTHYYASTTHFKHTTNYQLPSFVFCFFKGKDELVGNAVNNSSSCRCYIVSATINQP
jgi:hypothetical protein